MWFLRFLFLHRGGSAERVEENVLVFLPVASLRVRGRSGITLKIKTTVRQNVKVVINSILISNTEHLS